MLFPAHAGVIPRLKASRPSSVTIPRTRGGDPVSLAWLEDGEGYSPHTRG